MYNKISSFNCFDDAVFSELQKKLGGYPGRVTNIDSKYSFDDGSIWKVIKAEDGKEYLVKEIENDEIVRLAFVNNVYVKDVRNIAEILNLFILNDKTYNYFKTHDLMQSLKMEVTKSLIDYINNNLKEKGYKNISDIVNDIIKYINDTEINSISDLNDIIDMFIKE